MSRNQLFRCLDTPAAVLAIALTIVNWAWAGSKYKVLYGFKGGEDGGGVHAGVALDEKGNLFGTTSGGGAHGEGTAFELRRHSNGKWSETVLHSFCAQPECSDGASPESTPVFDAGGNLYGATNGTSFELSPGQNGWTFSLIYDAGSASGYAIEVSGKLYGANGGVWSCIGVSTDGRRRFFIPSALVGTAATGTKH